MNAISLTKKDLKNKIIDFINKDNVNNCKVEFVFSPGQNNLIDLFVITNNPEHNTLFLFSKSWGVNETNALENALKDLEHPKKQEENSYTVRWEKIGETTQVSYFTGHNMFDVLNKFYHLKNPKDFIIFSLNLNPIS